MSYRRGAAFERRIQAELEERGYLVIRSAGSHSAVDLVAVGRGKAVLLIQCKKALGEMTKARALDDWNDLWSWGAKTGAAAVVVGYARGSRRPAWYRLLGPRLAGVRERPWGAYVVEGG